MTNNDEDTSRQAESLWRSDDWADLRWAREHSTPQQIARHLLDPQWRNRDYNALDELVEMTHDADLSSLSEDDLETLAASSLPELRQSVIRYKDTPARLLEDMARTESNTRLLQMLVESGRLSQNTIDLCCWNQTDSRLAASMLPKALRPSAGPAEWTRLVAVQKERRRIRQTRQGSTVRNDRKGEPSGRRLGPDRHGRVRHGRRGQGHQARHHLT